jgi:hypothetical protein
MRMLELLYPPLETLLQLTNLKQHTEINTKIESPAPTQTQQQRSPKDYQKKQLYLLPTSAPYATTRSKLKQSHAIDILRNIEDPLFPLYSAFSVIQERPRLHRDQLPPPPRTYAEFLRYPYQREFRRAMDIEYDTLETRGAFKKVQKTNDITGSGYINLTRKATF